MLKKSFNVPLSLRDEQIPQQTDALIIDWCLLFKPHLYCSLLLIITYSGHTELQFLYFINPYCFYTYYSCHLEYHLPTLPCLHGKPRFKHLAQNVEYVFLLYSVAFCHISYMTYTHHMIHRWKFRYKFSYICFSVLSTKKANFL